MNVGSQKNIQRVYDGGILIGDAAAWVNPLTGGGICNAILSGKIAGEVIHSAFRKNNFSRQFLSEYQTRCDKLMRTEILGSYLIQRSFSELPFLIDPILKIANSNVISLFLNKIQYLTDIEIKAK
jgi:flavin-dependent dehydrogenase